MTLPLSPSILAILPEILLLVLAGFILAFDALWPEERRRNLGWLAFGGLVAIMAAALLFGLPSNVRFSALGGMVSHDWMSFALKLLFIFGAAITALFVMDMPKIGTRGEFYILMIVSTIGMCLMASADNLVMLYLAIETTSIPLYIMAGFLRRNEKSTEAGFKYLMFGAVTSAVMLYGFSLLFGLTGATDLRQIANSFYAAGAPILALTGSLLLILVGFGFKISAVPFHFWAPDVYEGAPTPVAGFLSTASKAAGFVVLLRVLLIVFTPALVDTWVPLIAALSVATMTLGNFTALAQKNIKRLLAYSSIAHAGYMLVGVVAISPLGVTSVVFYLIAYLLTNLAAFGAVIIFSHIVGSDEIASYAGLSRRSPYLALAMLISFLSLAGMPPFGGFVAKVFVFAAAVQANFVWLALVGFLNSIVGLYYYLTVLKVVYLYRAPDEAEERKPLPVPRPYALALGILTIGILLVGILFSPWFTWATNAALAMF